MTHEAVGFGGSLSPHGAMIHSSITCIQAVAHLLLFTIGTCVQWVEMVTMPKSSNSCLL